MTRPCSYYIDLMHLYLDGRLSDGQYQDLIEHLDICSSCRKRMTYLRVITAEVRGQKPEIPAGLHAAIMDNVRKNGKHPIPRRAIRWVGGLAACAAMLLVLLQGPMADVWKADALSGKSAETQNGSNAAGMEPDEAFDPSSLMQGTNGTPGSPEDELQNQTKQEDGETTEQEPSEEEPADYSAPQLMTSEQFSEYLIATGTVNAIPAYFPLESVVLYPDEKQVYIYIDSAKTEEAKGVLLEMGLTVYDRTENLPETVKDAPNALIVIFLD